MSRHSGLTDDEARALAQAGRHEEAIARALEAAEGLQRAGDDATALEADRLRALWLLQMGRDPEAELLLRQVFDAALTADLAALRAAAARPLSALLARTGRIAEAERLWAEYAEAED